MNISENNTTIYCGDQQINGLEDINPPLLHADDVPQTIGGAENISLTIEIQSGTYEEELRKRMHELRILKRIAIQVIEPFLYATNTNPKWWHYYKHAKKARIRTKYFKRLFRQAYGERIVK